MKKLLSIFLLTSMLLTAAACSGGDDSGAADTTTADNGGEDAAVETTTAEIGPDLPDMDFDGYVFRSLSRGANTGSTHWYIFDTVYDEEKAGDVVNDAVLERNTALEEKYNFKLKLVEYATDHQAQARTLILAGGDDFDIYGDGISYGSVLASEGLMVDFFTVPYIDLEADWWDQNAREELSIANSLYTMVNDFTLMDKHGTWITLFNKPMIDMFKLDNPYDLVNDGTWTMDKMYDMAKIVSFDVDGDGQLSEFDSWGTIGENWNVNALMVGADVRTFTKNSDDIPELTLNNERALNAYTKAHSIIADKNITLFSANVKGTYTDQHLEGIAPAMEDNRALFYITGMNRVILLRGMETDFGIIPNPKYDENQEEYRTIMTYGNTNAISIPLTNTDLERTGIILEALAYESSKTTLPAYIETTIKGKHSRDEESVAMLDLIFDSRTFDLGIIFGWGGVSSFYTGMVSSTDPQFASTLAANEANYVAKMQETVDRFLENQ